MLSAVFSLAAPERMNVLFIIADDLSWQHLGAYGCDFIDTPHADGLAHRGVRFTNCFTSNPKCAPSRASILTGRNTWQLESGAVHYSYFPDFPTFTDCFEQAGYAVGYTGKGWGPGTYDKFGREHNPAGREWNKRTLQPPFKGIKNIDYVTNFADFLAARSDGQAFCFWFGVKEPHRSYQKGSGVIKGKDPAMAAVPPYLPDDEVIRGDLLDYAVEVEWFDEQVGKALALLEEQGVADNTLIMLTSDNGMPFPRVKGQIYDDDYRLPLIVAWPQKIKQAQLVEDFINFSDIAPTLLAAAELPVPETMIGGRSFLDILLSAKSGRIDPERNFMLIGKERHDLGRPEDAGYPVRAIRTRRYLYVRNFHAERWPAGNPETGYGNCDGSPSKARVLELHEQGESRWWKYAFGLRPEEELYDLEADPHCMKNLAGPGEYVELRARLWQQMQTALVEQKDPRMLGDGERFDTMPHVGSRRKSWEHYLKRRQKAP